VPVRRCVRVRRPPMCGAGTRQFFWWFVPPPVKPKNGINNKERDSRRIIFRRFRAVVTFPILHSDNFAAGSTHNWVCNRDKVFRMGHHSCDAGVGESPPQMWSRSNNCGVWNNRRCGLALLVKATSKRPNKQ
jgi:hypothetical protein